MDDETHVGLVDTHAERDGCHYHVDALHEEVVLRLRPRGAVEACMVGRRLNVVGQQYLGQLFHFLARQTVYDTALALVLPNEHEDRKSTRLNSSHANISYAV